MEVVETVDAAGAPTAVQDYTVHQALELRRKILTDGIDSMPALQPIPTQTVHIDPLDELLPDEPAPRSPGSGAYYLFPPR